MATFLNLPPEIIEPIIQQLNTSDLCSVRQTCRYLCKASNRAFVQRISRNQYFTVEESFQKLLEIAHHEYFHDLVDSLRIHPHSLTWNPDQQLPALAREEVDYSRWLTHPLTSDQRQNFRRKLLYNLQHAKSPGHQTTLVKAFSGLSKLSSIEIGSWGQKVLDVEKSSKTMRTFREETNLGLLHFDWLTLWEANLRGTTSSCDGDCSLTEDFNIVIGALSESQKPISSLKAHYWSDLGLKCVQMQDTTLLKLLPSLKPALSSLRVLHLCLGFERGRRSSDPSASLANSKTWLADLVKLTPDLVELRLVFDGWAQWEVRPDPEAPDWSGSIFHHFVKNTAGFKHLRRLDLQNMFVRWRDVDDFLHLHDDTLVELSLNRVTMWSVLSWTQSSPDPETDTSSWLTKFKDGLRSMQSLEHVNLSWLCINGRMMCFHQNNFRHCLGCDENVVKPTDYGVETCPHYAFGVNREVNFLRGLAARRLCGPGTSKIEDFLKLPVAMVPMHRAFPLYYQADENDYAAQWNYYDGTIGRWETPGPELGALSDSGEG